MYQVISLHIQEGQIIKDVFFHNSSLNKLSRSALLRNMVSQTKSSSEKVQFII